MFQEVPRPCGAQRGLHHLPLQLPRPRLLPPSPDPRDDLLQSDLADQEVVMTEYFSQSSGPDVSIFEARKSHEGERSNPDPDYSFSCTIIKGLSLCLKLVTFPKEPEVTHHPVEDRQDGPPPCRGVRCLLGSVHPPRDLVRIISDKISFPSGQIFLTFELLSVSS